MSEKDLITKYPVEIFSTANPREVSRKLCLMYVHVMLYYKIPG